MALLHAGKQPEHRANEGGLSVNCSLKTIDYHFWIHPSYSSCHRSGGRVHLDRSIPALRFLISFLNFLWHSLWLMLWDLHFGTSFIYLFDGSQAPLCSVKQRPLTFIFDLLADLRSVCRQSFSSCLSVDILFIYSDEWTVSESCGVDFRETLGTRTHWYLQHTHSPTHSPPYAAKKQTPSAWLMYANMFLHIREDVSVINRCNKRAKWKFLVWFVCCLSWEESHTCRQ